MKRIHLVSKLAVVFLSAVIPLGCSERPALSNTTMFLVSDYGAVGDGQTDDRPAILAAFAAAKACDAPAAVVFEDKHYLLGDNPDAWHALVLAGFEDLIIEGNGATLLCSKDSLSFYFKDSRNITVRGLTLDETAPRFSQGEVLAVDVSGFMDVKIMEGYPEPPVEAFMKANNHQAHGGGGRHMIVFEKGGESRNTTMSGDHLYIENIQKVSDGVFRFFVTEHYLPHFSGVAVGNWITYGFGFVDVPRSVVDAKFKSDSFYGQIEADRVENMTFEDINIYGSINGGIRVSDMPGDVTVRNVNIVRKPGTKNLMSIPSDALHLMSIRGRLVVEDCLVEAPGDDCLNIGTLMETIVSRDETNPRRMTLRTTDNIYYYYTIEKGDRLQFMDFESKKVLGVATVEAVSFDRPSREHHVTLDREIDGLDEGTVRVMNLEQMTSSTLLRNNTMKPTMRNAMLVRAQNMTIKSNRLDCSHGGVVGISVYPSMGEYARNRNLKITDNAILNAQVWSITVNTAFQLADGRYDTQQVEVSNNVFEMNRDRKTVEFRGVEELTWRDNRFKRDGDMVDDDSATVSFSNCTFAE